EGRRIQKPYKLGNGQYFNELNQRFMSGELTQEITRTDSVTADGRIYANSTGKLFKVNGGIMPDVNVPLDTTALTPLYKQIQDKDLVSRFVYNHLINFPASFAFGNFIADFQFLPQVFQQYVHSVRTA